MASRRIDYAIAPIVLFDFLTFGLSHLGIKYDKTISALDARFNLEAENCGLQTYIRLEEIITNDQNMNSEMLRKYPEIDVGRFDIQIKMFHQEYRCKSLKDVQSQLQSLTK